VKSAEKVRRAVDVQAMKVYNACMADIQYTIRGIPERLDKKIREIAAKENKSLNETALGALQAGVGLSDAPVRYTDLDEFAGTWVDDPEFDRAIREMDQIDPELWK
jgi:hypothetical protein